MEIFFSTLQISLSLYYSLLCWNQTNSIWRPHSFHSNFFTSPKTRPQISRDLYFAFEIRLCLNQIQSNLARSNGWRVSIRDRDFPVRVEAWGHGEGLDVNEEECGHGDLAGSLAGKVDELPSPRSLWWSMPLPNAWINWSANTFTQKQMFWILLGSTTATTSLDIPIS